MNKRLSGELRGSFKCPHCGEFSVPILPVPVELEEDEALRITNNFECPKCWKSWKQTIRVKLVKFEDDNE